MARPNQSSQNIIDGPRGPGDSALNNFRHVLEMLFSELEKKNKNKYFNFYVLYAKHYFYNGFIGILRIYISAGERNTSLLFKP